MARLAAAPLELTEEQRQALEAMVRKHLSPHQLGDPRPDHFTGRPGLWDSGHSRPAAHGAWPGAELVAALADNTRKRCGRTAAGGLTAAGGTGHLSLRAELCHRGAGRRVAGGQWPPDQPLALAGTGR